MIVVEEKEKVYLVFKCLKISNIRFIGRSIIVALYSNTIC